LKGIGIRGHEKPDKTDDIAEINGEKWIIDA